jgi:flagellar protein FliO/FliZ
MKRYMAILILFFILYPIPSATFASGSSLMAADSSVYDTIQKGAVDKAPSSSPSKEAYQDQSTSLLPLLLKFIVSFLFVILLLVVLMRFLSKRTRLLQSNGPVLPIGGHMLGQNRSVQVILIGQTIYILGVGETVQLIRAIPQGEEYQHLLEGYESQSDGISTLTKDVKQKWNRVFHKHMRNMDHENGEE